MQFIIWTGVAVLGLITVSGVGMIFFHLVAEFRNLNAQKPVEEPNRPMSRREGLHRVDLEALRDRPPVRRAA
ncbi:MAG: hypothetical protein ACI80V_003616 [Rhodothermales bacterium]|jgi:hypothetical protein